METTTSVITISSDSDTSTLPPTATVKTDLIDKASGPDTEVWLRNVGTNIKPRMKSATTQYSLQPSTSQKANEKDKKDAEIQTQKPTPPRQEVHSMPPPRPDSFTNSTPQIKFSTPEDVDTSRATVSSEPNTIPIRPLGRDNPGHTRQRPTANGYQYTQQQPCQMASKKTQTPFIVPEKETKPTKKHTVQPPHARRRRRRTK